MNVLSANSRLPNLSEMQDTSCNNQRYMKMYTELKAKVCEMQIQLADLEKYKCEIENIQSCSDIVRQLESRVLKLERENIMEGYQCHNSTCFIMYSTFIVQYQTFYILL